MQTNELSKSLNFIIFSIKMSKAAIFSITSFLLLIGLFPRTSLPIQCYSGNQFSIIECPSLYCIKQTLGLDTVRYCDGTGVSSICSTYRISDSCQNVPNLGYICCCSDQLCNSSLKSSIPVNKFALTFGSFLFIWLLGIVRNKLVA